MLRRIHPKARQQPRVHSTAIHDLPEAQQRLIRSGLEALRDPDMDRRVSAHLQARGDSPRDVIAAALVAGRFQREQIGFGQMQQDTGAMKRASRKP